MFYNRFLGSPDDRTFLSCYVVYNIVNNNIISTDNIRYVFYVQCFLRLPIQNDLNYNIN